MHYRLLLTLFLWITIASCRPDSKNEAAKNAIPATPKAIVEKEIALDSIPSGSGLVKHGETYFLISDDSPYCFQLDQECDLLQKNAIRNGQKTSPYRLPKAEKPDYESATLAEINGERYLLAFGSGSKSPQRDSLLLVNLRDPGSPETYSLKPFYNLLLSAANLPAAELNVEGSAVIGDELFLLNRGQNVLYQTSLPETVAFAKQKAGAPKPSIKVFRIPLPKLNGITPGFSGACQLGSENRLLFTASAENTKNWVADGEIMGSLVGILNVGALAQNPLEAVAFLTDKNGRVLKEKAESVEYLRTEPNGDLRVLALTDDDKGGSKILEIRLQLPTGNSAKTSR